MEQREGRIRRYKGHAVGRNVGASHADDVFAAWRAGDDIWPLMFDLSDKAARTGDEKRPVSSCAATPVHGGGQGVRRAEAAVRRPTVWSSGGPAGGRRSWLRLPDRAGVDVARCRTWAVDLSPPGPPCLLRSLGEARDRMDGPRDC